MANISESAILTTKDVKALLNVQDDRTARKYLKDIKLHFQTPKVLYCHFKTYFKHT
jgi:hypothetical protein